MTNLPEDEVNPKGLIEFKPWPKTPRLNRRMVVTEKIDGCNMGVIITEDGYVGSQSRNHLVEPGKHTDHYGFAAWVQQNRDKLAETLGPGHHYGEWWGVGIQRGYGLRERRFSLFNTHRWGEVANPEQDWVIDPDIGLYVVPTLHTGDFNSLMVNHIVDCLAIEGSVAAPGFDRPEGVIVWHEASRTGFKVTVENDAQWKGQAG